MTPSSRGAFGERIAALYFASRGYVVLARNQRVGRREIDLVVERGALLVAVEVKWRRADDPCGGSRSAWSPAQRRRLLEAWALARASFAGGLERPCRVDLVTLEERADGLDLRHVRAAVGGGPFFA